MPRLVVCLASLAISLPALAAERADILIADFEGTDYGDWKVEGEAFGPGPARGTLPNQMPVGGYLGKGLVNSYFKGDGTTGTLASPPLKVERRYVSFLVGGGKYSGETCVNLLLDGKVVRTATGPNDQPGGSEELDWHTWDVADLEGKTVTIQIVDKRTGGWGHINVDHILQGDRKAQAEPARREITLAKRYLHLPVKTGAAKRRLKLTVDDRTVREFEIELAATASADEKSADEKPDFHAFCDVGAWAGRKLTIEVGKLPIRSKALEGITQSDELPAAGELYREKHRPQFHFTSRRGWLNDPNGLVYLEGEYHLFYQHNPYGWAWGNMHWGHAVSKDLVRWKEQPIALYPQKFGDWCFSGSAVVDARNTAGFKAGDADVLVAAYTSTGRGECIVYSNDRGRTWKEYAGNPVVRHQGRDPKLLWHEPTRRWVMAVYDEHAGGQHIAFYTSPDLKQWGLASRIEGFFECPDLFELPVIQDGKAKDTARKAQPAPTRWVLYAADGKYILGDFDGRTFRRESGKHQVWHGNFYAAQTFSDVPDGRRIQIGWANGVAFPGMPFNQQMTIPVELTLHAAPDGPRMFAEPVKELASLHGAASGAKHELPRTVIAGSRSVDGVKSDLLRIVAELEPGKAQAVGLIVRGVPIEYDTAKQQLTCRTVAAPVKLTGGLLRLEVLVDRGSVEIFAGRGATALSVAVIPDEKNRSVVVTSRGGQATLRSLVAWELERAW
jgi:fructan beta-fructosidase